MKKSMRKNLSVLIGSLSLIALLFIYAKPVPKAPVKHANTTVTTNTTTTAAAAASPASKELGIYESLDLGTLGLSREAFDYAKKGHDYLAANGKLQNEDILSIVDFSQASSKKRLYIIDLKNRTLLFNTYVSHGRGSGREMATEFSNDAESHKSSLGFYVTGDTYMGKHGFSLRLLGQDKGFNDNADSRAIVMHSAAYVSEDAIRMQGFIGRSFGCPAVPEALHKPIIEKIKNGSCLFLYSPSKSYVANSTIISKLA